MTRAALEQKRLVILVIAGALALVVLLAIRPSPRRARDEAGTVARVVADAATPAAQATGPLGSGEWARVEAVLPAPRPAANPDGGDGGVPTAWDPFRPPPIPPAAAEADGGGDDSMFRLEGIALSPARREGPVGRAILNDRVVRVGDELEGFRVVAIERGKVVLEHAGRKTEIRLRPVEEVE